jgi:xanthine dehydrogenase accessory factor
MSEDTQGQGYLSDGGLGDWSAAFGVLSDVRPVMTAARADGEPFALATLYATEGGAPHGLGAQMLLSPRFAAGFLSGGCIEGDVALHARAVLADGAPRRLVYGRGGPPDIKLLCGARIEVLVEAVPADDVALARLLELSETRRPALWLSDGRRRVCLAEGEAVAGVPAALRAARDRAVAEPGLSAAVGDAVFRRYDPAPQLVAAGADPTAFAAVTLAMQIGWAAILVRPKGPEGGPPIPGVRYLRGDVLKALTEARLDPWTAVAATSHEIEADNDVLVAALRSEAAYVGVLGSRKRIPDRIAGLKASGLGDDAIGRLKAPIGLDIRAQSPWEIAVSIIADITAELKARQAERRWPAPAMTPA